jgi:hypothetical protein
MTILIDTLALPAGLKWSDEFAWAPTAQSTAYGLTGSLLVQESTRLAGRPLTLSGGNPWAWIARADLLTLRAALASTGEHTVTLLDGRRFTVIPRHEGDGALAVSMVATVRNSGPADPDDETLYWLDELRFLILAELEPLGP